MWNCSSMFSKIPWKFKYNLKYFQQRNSSPFFCANLKWSPVKMIWMKRECMRGGKRHPSLCKVRGCTLRRMSGLLLSVKSSCKNSLDSFWQEVKFEFIWRCVIIIFKICTPIMQNITQMARYSLVFFPRVVSVEVRRYKRTTHVFIWMRINYTGVNNWYKGAYICQVQEVIDW